MPNALQGRGEREKAWKDRYIRLTELQIHNAPGASYLRSIYDNIIEGMEVEEARCLLGLHQLDPQILILGVRYPGPS